MKRSNSLDALRGLAILLMVLSGSIAFGGVLPAWMFHAQVPPPAHTFNPDLPGITWVDLVFPFFLFSMGAAIPLALHKKAQAQTTSNILWQVVQRYLLLAFFAILTMHARAWVMQPNPTAVNQWLSIACFVVLFLIYAHTPQIDVKWLMTFKASGFILAVVFLRLYPFKGGFDINKSDIIIIVLANMALFSSVIWLFTRNHPLLRIGILPFIMAVFLSSKIDGSWNAVLFNWSPAPWLYKFHYLKYLFIVLPGTLAGEWLQQYLSQVTPQSLLPRRNYALAIILLCWLLLIGNLTGLFTRMLVVNLIFSIVTGITLLFLQSKLAAGADKNFIGKLLQTGIYLLWLGLFFEAYEGGIKKDFSTYSYYFVSSGLAFVTLASFQLAERLQLLNGALHYLAQTGKNPMIAYTAGNLLLMPLLKLTGAEHWLDSLNTTAPGGFLRGVLFTGIVSAVTVLCTRKKIFWKT